MTSGSPNPVGMSQVPRLKLCLRIMTTADNPQSRRPNRTVTFGTSEAFRMKFHWTARDSRMNRLTRDFIERKV